MYDLNDNNTAPQDQPRGLWENWSRRRILLLAGLLMGGNLFFQVWLYTMKEDLFLPVLGGAVGGVFLPLILVAQRHGFSLRRDFGLVDVRPAVLAASALLTVCTLVPTSFLAELSLRLFPADPAWESFMLEHLPTTPYEIFLAVLAVVFMAPLAEEIIFRGLLQRVFALKFGPWAAVLLAALVFAAVHLEPWFIFGLVGVGIMLGFIFATTGSVTACWVAHALHNAISLWFMMSAQDGLAEPQAVTTPDWWLMAGSILGMVLVGKYLLVAGKRST